MLYITIARRFDARGAAGCAEESGAHPSAEVSRGDCALRPSGAEPCRCGGRDRLCARDGPIACIAGGPCWPRNSECYITCRQFDDAILDAAGGGHASPSLRAHLASCTPCSVSLQQQKSLTRGLRALAAADGGGPPADLEARLMDAFRQRVDAESSSPWRAVLGAAAAVLLVATSLEFAWREFEQAQNRFSVAEAEFVPWPGAAMLPSFESGSLVRTELPADVLPLLGIELASSSGSETVMADVLVGQDGPARAVRLAQ